MGIFFVFQNLESFLRADLRHIQKWDLIRDTLANLGKLKRSEMAFMLLQMYTHSAPEKKKTFFPNSSNFGRLETTFRKTSLHQEISTSLSVSLSLQKSCWNIHVIIIQ